MPASYPELPNFLGFLSAVAAMILISAIAFASPLDPSWLGGVYDRADGDDVMSLVDNAVASESACLPDMPSPFQFYKPPFTTNPTTTSSYSASRFMRGPPLLSTPSHLPLPCQTLYVLQLQLDVPATGQTRGSITLGIVPTYIVQLDQPMSALVR